MRMIARVQDEAGAWHTVGEMEVRLAGKSRASPCVNAFTIERVVCIHANSEAISAFLKARGKVRLYTIGKYYGHVRHRLKSGRYSWRMLSLALTAALRTKLLEHLKELPPCKTSPNSLTAQTGAERQA